MIVGNPHEFAIYFDVVDEWSSETFKNGVFSYIIGGVFFPDNPINATIGTEFLFIKEFSDRIMMTKESSTILKMTTCELSNYLHHDTFEKHNGFNSNSKYLISTQSMIDRNCFIYVVKSKIFSKIIINYNEIISELLIHTIIFDDIISKTLIKSEDFYTELRKAQF